MGAPAPGRVLCSLSVRENLELFAHLERLEDPRGAAAGMLEQTGLGRRAEEPVARLSGGNRQRVNVALGLIADPPVLALDEPTAALDPGQRERLWEFIEELVEGGTAVLFSTHNVSEVAPPRPPGAGPRRGHGCASTAARPSCSKPAGSPPGGTSSGHWCGSSSRPG